MRRYIAAIIASTCVSGSAFAADVWHTALVKYVYPQANGDVVITFQTDAPSCPSPNQPKYHYLIVNTNGVTAEGLKNMYALFLVAFAQGKPVNINFNNSNGSCAINRAYISE